MRGRTRGLAVAVLTAIVVGASASSATSVYRAFSDRSFWNRAIPQVAPRHPYSDQIIAFLQADNDTDYISLAGTTSSGEWGMPIYWPDETTRVYDVGRNCPRDQPPEFDHVRIPRGAKPDPTRDAAMTVVDRNRGIAYGFHHTRYDPLQDRWTSCGGTVYYLKSNGLHGDLSASDDVRNRGHRGVPPTVSFVRFDEIQAGAIDHVLKIAVDRTKCRHVFPMIDDECGTLQTYAPPEGVRIRIKPGVDLSRFGLSPAALVIARALKRYGAIIGDQTGGPIVLKVENTVAEGDGFRWQGRLTADSLQNLSLRYFEVVRPGYQP
jgi:hypothetical protein